MPIIAATGKHRRKVRFSSTNQAPAAQASKHSSFAKSSPLAAHRAPQSSRTTMTESSPAQHPGVPALFTELPRIRDSLSTETTELQQETVQKCLPFLKATRNQSEQYNQHGVPGLLRDEHIAYLYDSLEDFPDTFVSLDASRPWMTYWALAGLALLGEDTRRVRERALSTFRPMQNPTGGFGGGHGQMSHCASSYAVVLSLAMVGGEDAFRLIDRKAMWRWLGRLKQGDGGFTMCEGGEEDVRGAYCAMVIISLLDLPLDLPAESAARQHGRETFTSGLAEYLSRCQTFEGGISGSPGSEAHGAYAFCALACLCILGQPEVTVSRCMDLPLLLSWLSARQYAPEGGFSGRTNKLVDGCYSHWVGSCWPLIQSALDGPLSTAASQSTSVGRLYSREGLTRYILACCQSKNGGLRDKPGKRPDSYHTCYTLTGLSNTQHHHYRTESSASTKDTLPSSFQWKHRPFVASDDKGQDRNVFDESDRLRASHPVYVIPYEAAEGMRLWFEQEPFNP
ncbi:CaaX farnesyltransferase beta subunit Ram1 [Aspergillus campestris IBT 28561]|uniref:Protein farnesyltransferase subunit beta n=1 Tax=Aspergillus campestris (strain IBT 28561) TaxID=1392248 RepID=A0A2I1CYH6_ASPC2|nr:CaaX farnesyltransferase beta subunit Ram1 [Aspergillus campestris IBT 28561]PKY02673.1 CaaX farnesyltransferase beta subunit Ram1 [Aspergillus campestris IBT 28561]